MNSKKKYALFDLDGTLLPLNTDLFLENYVKAITPHFVPLVEPRLFASQLMASSYATIANPEAGKTNRDKFLEDFLPKVNRSLEEMMPIFDRFYATEFRELRAYSSPSPMAREVVSTALKAGYGIVLATNPIFPREAVLERMSWAGIADLPWDLITSYEETHFCKPNPDYFREILDRLCAKAEDCVHFGNDLTEDMAARKADIPVVMVTDYLINRHNKPLEDLLFHGTLEEATKWFGGYVAGR